MSAGTAVERERMGWCAWGRACRIALFMHLCRPDPNRDLNRAIRAVSSRPTPTPRCAGAVYDVLDRWIGDDFQYRVWVR